MENKILVKSVITQYCLDEKLFTSVDIANACKNLGVWVRNRDVAEFMRENVLDIARSHGRFYTENTIIVDAGFQTYAQCYAPNFKNSQDYLSRDLTPITPRQFEELHGYNPIPINKRK